jgi:phosphoenolpyruvate synthase/pyruvate phosphate dikinase
MEQEAVAKAITKAAKKDAGPAKAGGARSIDLARARHMIAEVASTSTLAQIRKRLDWDEEFARMALAVPEVRAEYRKIMKARKHLRK